MRHNKPGKTKRRAKSPAPSCDAGSAESALVLPADAQHIKRERQKAKDLKKTPYWKNKLSKGECYYCGKEFSANELSMDHLTPLARWGRTTKSNVVPACKECNFAKKHKTLVEIRLNK